MDYHRAEVITEEVCIPGRINTIFQNPPLPLSTFNCIHASRKVLCGLCSTRTGISYEFPSSPQPLGTPPLLPFVSPTNNHPKIPKLSKKNATIVREKLEIFALKVRRAERDKPKYWYLPEDIHFPSALVDEITTNFRAISSLPDSHPLIQDWMHHTEYRLQLLDVLSEAKLLIGGRSQIPHGSQPKGTKRKVSTVVSEEDSTEDDAEMDIVDDQMMGDDSLSQIPRRTAAANKPVGGAKTKRPRKKTETLAQVQDLYSHHYNTTRAQRAHR
jgi:hypothetical protein